MTALKVMDNTYPLCNAEKKQSEVSVFHPQEKPGGGITIGVTTASFCKEFNVGLGSRHHVSQPLAAVCLLTRLGMMDCLGDESFSAFLHFTFDKTETPIYALSSQKHTLPELCPLLAKYSLHTLCHFQTVNTAL